MRTLRFLSLLLFVHTFSYAQEQGFFLNQWQPLQAITPDYSTIEQTTKPVTASIKVLFADTLTKIPAYLFGDNANVYTGCMSNKPELIKNIRNRNSGVLRGPSGSISDVFFWNRSIDQRPDDIPTHLAGQTTPFEPWYGVRPYTWENWTMAVDSFYSILNQTVLTGMLTVNYGYARYGTGPTPVNTAAHLAADWVRYDNGRTKFWEIGNEVFGNWEAGYRIDPSLNQDNQPEYITPSLYAQHCLVFIDSMKSAAAEIGVDIKIGLVMLDAYSAEMPTWNKDVAAIAGNSADFYSVHSYYTPWNQNSSSIVILNSYNRTKDFKSFVYNEVAKAGKPLLPVALTEYNIFAVGSKQPVSHINGMHAVLVTGEAIKQKYGAALRWDLANGWDNGNDHGMYSNGDEPGVILHSPRPAFYHLYYQRRFTGDILLNSTQRGDTNVIVYPTAFSSGHVALTIVNRSINSQVVRVNIKDYKFGSRYYLYSLTGENGIEFSRKLYVNGIGNTSIAGGPANYETIKAHSCTIGEEIKVELPARSSNFVLIEPGEKQLSIDESIAGNTPFEIQSDVQIFPNPTTGTFYISNLPEGECTISVMDCSGRVLYKKESLIDNSQMIECNAQLTAGQHIVKITSHNHSLIRKIYFL